MDTNKDISKFRRFQNICRFSFIFRVLSGKLEELIKKEKNEKDEETKMKLRNTIEEFPNKELLDEYSLELDEICNSLNIPNFNVFLDNAIDLGISMVTKEVGDFVIDIAQQFLLHKSEESALALLDFIIYCNGFPAHVDIGLYGCLATYIPYKVQNRATDMKSKILIGRTLKTIASEELGEIEYL